jgi:hypothetical protein
LTDSRYSQRFAAWWSNCGIGARQTTDAIGQPVVVGRGRNAIGSAPAAAASSSTSLRLIESAAGDDGTLRAFAGETALFVDNRSGAGNTLGSRDTRNIAGRPAQQVAAFAERPGADVCGDGIVVSRPARTSQNE